ncbi:TfoX/Sxy family DNA transformation protein [Celeribacter neptunius]|uniref:TfoX C-terminal domain-containing protein n=1 Tax=Celeribacter neptunius TaxID=588602 RepID=A0A1I3KG80_9RHOB|nr:TfoX/Sxy family DNA transformation protein [Celeribacter neptunius]SFI71404.1 TfoX C-terminal domain-containing protein [Celeribacter neptunius]
MTDSSPPPVSSIRNLGPASDASFARAGIASADALRELGADAAYARLLATGSRPHFIGYYALVMGLQGRPWNDCKGKEKDALRDRFDKIVAGARADESAAPIGIEATLNEIGTGLKR